MGYIPHLITLIFVIAVVAMGITNLLLIHKVDKAPFLQHLLYSMCLFQLLSMVTFTVNQIGWVINEHESVVGFEAQIGWLAYDYLNKLFHLSTAAVLHYYLKYKHVEPKQTNRRRATDV